MNDSCVLALGCLFGSRADRLLAERECAIIHQGLHRL